MIHNISGKDRRYDTVFFDFDGTIADSGEGCVNAVRHMFSSIGMEENDEKRLLAFVGPPVKHHLKDCYGFDDQQAAEAYAHFSSYYRSKGLKECRLFSGIEDALKRIRAAGKTMYVATSKQEYMARKLLGEFGLASYFDRIFGADHENGISNKAQVLQNAVNVLGGLPQNAVMVGDRYHDIEGAKAVGLDSIGVLYGYGDEDELTKAGSDYLVDSINDLAQMLGGTNE
jgi:phosphoglycolate phosphatase